MEIPKDCEARSHLRLLAFPLNNWPPQRNGVGAASLSIKSSRMPSPALETQSRVCSYQSTRFWRVEFLVLISNSSVRSFSTSSETTVSVVESTSLLWARRRDCSDWSLSTSRSRSILWCCLALISESSASNFSASNAINSSSWFLPRSLEFSKRNFSFSALMSFKLDFNSSKSWDGSFSSGPAGTLDLAYLTYPLCFFSPPVLLIDFLEFFASCFGSVCRPDLALISRFWSLGFLLHFSVLLIDLLQAIASFVCWQWLHSMTIFGR